MACSTATPNAWASSTRPGPPPIWRVATVAAGATSGCARAYPADTGRPPTLIAGLRRTGMMTPMMLEGPINRDAFVVYVRQVLLPDVSRSDIAITDTLSSRKTPAARDAIEAVPPSCSSFRPTAATSTQSGRRSPSSRRISLRPPERTIHGLRDTIGRISTYPRNAPTTSLTLATMQTDGKPL